MKFLTSRVVVCAIILGTMFCGTNVRAVVDEDDFSTLTSKAYVDSLINSNDLSEHTINGAELGNQDSYFYGVSETSGNTAAKVVEIDSITDGSGTGLVIVVQPENTHTGTISNGLTLQLNSETAAEILYNGASVTDATASVVWNGDHPSVFVFDGAHWNFVGAMYDVMGVQEGITATDTTPRTLSAANIKGIVQGTKLTGLTTSNTLVSASDDVLTGIGKLQGQISAIPNYGHNMVNGASIRNENSTFYGVSSDRGTDPGKTVSIPSIDALVDGLIIVVRPAETSSVANSTLNLNNFGAKRMMYNGAPVTAETAPIVWNTGYPSTWVYDGTSWVFAGNGHDSTADISNLASHTINGAPLSNSASYFYDPAGGGAAISWEKTVSIPSITNLAAGQIITVKPSTTSGAIQPFGASRPSQMTLTLNADGRDNALAIPIIYNGNAVTGSEQSVVWNANYPSTFVYDGTNWVFMGRGYDANTEYGAISVSDGITGTDNTLHTVRADYLKQIIQGTTLTGLDTTSTAALDASDSITTAIGKLEGQKQSKIPATTSTYVYDQSTNPAADGSVVTTNTLGVTGERGIATAPTYDNNSQLTNGSWLPTVSAVSGMVSAGTPTGTPTYVATYLPHANGDPAGEGKVGGEVAIYDTANTYNASTDANKLATAGFVATKQNQIGATSDGTNNTPNYVYDATTNQSADGSVVTTGAADGTTGQRGIAKAVVSDGNGGYTNGDWLPTVNAMMGAISTATDTLTWDSLAHPAAINVYNTTFGSDTNNWTGNATDLINGQFLANALNMKQNKLPGQFNDMQGDTNLRPRGAMTIKLEGVAGYVSPIYITASGDLSLVAHRDADPVISYIDGTKTLSEFQTSNFGSTDSTTVSKNEKYIKGALVSLETLKDVYSALNTKITNNALPTGTSGTVVTYNGTNSTTGVQQFSEVAIYDTANAYNASTDANKLATAGFVATKQNQIGATSDGTNNTPNYVYDATTNQSADGSVVTTGATDGTTGQRGIAKAVVSDGNGGYTNGDWLPTVNAMMGAIGTATDTLTWTSTETTATNNYSITFDGETGNWPAADADKLINGTALANALSLKQKFLPALSTGDMAPDDPTLGGGMTIHLTNTPGEVETRYIAGGGGVAITAGGTIDVLDYVEGGTSLDDYASDSGLTVNQIRQTLVSLQTLKDMYSDISDNIADAVDEVIPTGTVGYVATYLPHANGDPAGKGKVGDEVAIYDTANAYNASTDADKLATAGFVATKQDTITPAFIDVPNIDPDLNDGFQVLGMVTTNSTFNGLTSGHIGILDNDTAFGVFTIGNASGTLLNLNNGTLSSLYPNNTPVVNQLMSDFDHVVPTALAVGEALGELQMAMEPLTWTSTETTATNNYSITFDGETGNWPTADAGKLIDGTALANALSTKQRKITRSPLSFTSSGAVGSSATYIVPATIATSTKRNANESNEIDAQTYGIMDSSTANNAEGGLKGFSTSYYQGQFPNNVKPMDKFVPTVRAVALALADVDWDPIVWRNTHETLINAYSTSFASGMIAPREEWPAEDADKLVNGTFIANALALKQNIIPVRGTARDTALRIVTYPQYGQSAGTIGELILDTASLYTTDNSHIPSSKLVSGLLDLELDKSLAWHMNGLDDFFVANHADVTTKKLFALVDMEVGGDSGAAVVLKHFNKYDVVPTMEVLAYALNGAYNTLENQLSINTYTTSETSSSISGGNISIPTALTLTEEYADDTKLTDTEQLFLVPWVRDNDNGAAGTAAGNLLTSYATNENIPTLDTLANALYGLYKTRKTSDDLFEDTIETSDVVIERLYELDPLDGNYTSFINSGYMDAFVPTISMLWNESRELYQMIETKQRIIPRAGYYLSLNVNPPVQVTDWGASAVRGVAIPTKSDSTYDDQLGERWIVDSDTNTSGWPAAKLNYAIPAVNWTQQKISASGRYDLNSGHYYNTNAENDAHSWLNSEVKGNGIVTRTSTNGVVGERMIFEEGDIDFYHEENLNENQMAIQDISIPTVAAVVEMIGEFSQNKKTCYEYKPGMPETDENCWLWEFQ